MLEGELGIQQGGFEGGEAVLARGDAELVDIAFFGVVAGTECGAGGGRVGVRGRGRARFGGEVDDGAGSGLKSVPAGAGFACGGLCSR